VGAPPTTPTGSFSHGTLGRKASDKFGSFCGRPRKTAQPQQSLEALLYILASSRSSTSKSLNNWFDRRRFADCDQGICVPELFADLVIFRGPRAVP